MTLLAKSVDGAFFRGYGGRLFADLSLHGLGTTMGPAVLLCTHSCSTVDDPGWFVCVWCKPANDAFLEVGGPGPSKR